MQSWSERNGFGLIAPIMVWFGVAFVLFQIVGGLIGFSIYLFMEEVDLANTSAILVGIQEHPLYLLTGNTFGQFLVIGLGSWLVAGIVMNDEEDRTHFFRIKSEIEFPDVYKVTLIAIVLLFVSYPLLMLVQYVNAFLPQPDFLQQMEEESIRILELFFKGDTPSWLIFLHVALTPAICEEIMFRGVFLRVFEKRFGSVAAIIITGLLFGFYHLRLTQVIVLSLIGMLLAYITIKTDRLWPAMLLHAANNGILSLAPRLFPNFTEKYLDTEQIIIPEWWILLISLVATTALMYIIGKNKSANRLTQPDVSGSQTGPYS